MTILQERRYLYESIAILFNSLDPIHVFFFLSRESLDLQNTQAYHTINMA